MNGTGVEVIDLVSHNMRSGVAGSWGGWKWWASGMVRFG